MILIQKSNNSYFYHSIRLDFLFVILLLSNFFFSKAFFFAIKLMIKIKNIRIKVLMSDFKFNLKFMITFFSKKNEKKQ